MGVQVSANSFVSKAALGGLIAALCLAGATIAAAAESRYFTTSDGVRLHYLEAGDSAAPPILFVPGWTMPAWIWERQIEDLSRDFHVFAFDPRGQGLSEVPYEGYEPVRRGRDIGELIQQRIDRPVLLAGWSLGVLDVLSYVRADGDARIAGLVLVDNSIGEGPPRTTIGRPQSPPPEATRAARRARFVAQMFSRDPGAEYREKLTAAALRMPAVSEQALLSYGVAREEWRRAVHSTAKPVLYVVRPRWRDQAESLVAARPNAESAMFDQAGHALFVDEPERFNALIRDFATRVWPVGPAQ